MLWGFNAMIEIKARISRSAIYLSGETLQCEITFSNVNTSTKECPSPRKANHYKEEKQSDKVERLAWSSVQIHCQCSVISGRVVIPGKEDATLLDNIPPISESRTSFAPSRG